MTKNKLSTYFVFISFFTVIAIFTSIVQKSYSNLVKSDQDPDTSNLLKKINPSLDTSIIQKIQNRPESIDSGDINFIQDDSIKENLTIIDVSEASPTSEINQDEGENSI